MILLQLPVIMFTTYFPGKAIDESLGLIDKLSLEQDITNGDWPSVENKLLQLPSDDLSRAIDGICDREAFSTSIEKYLESGRSEFQSVLAGAYYTKMAWKTRTSQWAKEVTDKQWEGFYQYIERATEQLDRTYQSDALRVEGTARRISVHMAESEKEAALFTFKNCQAMDSSHYLAHVRCFRTLTPRWLGSIEELRDFAYSIEDEKMGPLVRVMTAVEFYSDLHNEDEDTALRAFRAQHKELIKDVLKEATIPVDDSMTSITYKNYLACLYGLLKAKKQRTQILNQIKERITMHPWGYFGMFNERDIKLYKFVGLI